MFQTTYPIARALPALALALLAACNSSGSSSPPPVTGGRCVDFESLTPGTIYRVGDTFTDAGVTVTLEAFEWSSGTLYQDGRSEISSNQRAAGSGLEMGANNVNLAFDIGRTELVELRFAELGGNLNLRVNGEFQNFQNFSNVNGTTIGGVQVAVIGGFGNDAGRLTLTGVVERFAIGGQELWIDDVCFTP